MKFSEQWLRQWVNPTVGTDELVEQLTMAGLEVEGTESVAAEFTQVVVGEIVQCEPHPDANKLSVCQVASDEDELLQVVCGAPNAAKGLKVPFAKIGAVLPGNFKIKKAKLRGVESFGMLCAEQELGLADSSDGLMSLPADAPVGEDIRSYLELDDSIIEVDLTPNRGDCLGISGLAREVGVLNRESVTTPDLGPIAATIDDTLPVEISANEDCARYVGRVIKNVDVSAPTPLWMVERLRRSGIRSIDPVVDVTNYVLFELGQPMHAFDLDQLQGGIVVRHATAGEKLTLLDGQELELSPDVLVIADHERALAMAGIMGGEHSGVTDATQHIFLESAFFAPEKIAGRARSYSLHTDSSHRFERGVDYLLQRPAVERATQLLLDIVGGEPGPVIEIEKSESLPERKLVVLRRARITQTLGLTIPDVEVEDILTRLGLAVTSITEGWQVEVPSYRFDIAIEADLFEELARIYGYNQLPVQPLQGSISLPSVQESKIGLPVLRQVLVTRGYQEAVTYSFVEPGLMALLEPDIEPVALTNPLSVDMSVMRTNLWPGLLSAARYNLNRQRNRVRMFETGLAFVTRDALEQESRIAGLVTGLRLSENWANPSQQIDFYDIKGDVEALLDLSKETHNIQFKVESHPALHPGQSARIYKGQEAIGWIGALHPSLQKKLDIEAPIFLFELLLDAVQSRNMPKFKELSKFPEVRRDLAILIDKDVDSSAICDIVREKAGDYLIDLILFDVYEGKGIDSKRKSIALGLTFQHQSRTLTEDEVNDAVEKVVSALQQAFDAALRN